MLHALRARAAALLSGRRDPDPSAWVRVGGSYLYVGEHDVLERRPAPAAESERAGEVEQALDSAERGLDAGEAVAAEAEHAERVLGLLARAPDPALAAREADTLVRYLAARAREGRTRDVLRGAHVLLGAFLLAERLRELVQVLELARDAAERLGDAAEQAWALQNLGTLAAAAGKAPLATELFEQARALSQSGHGAGSSGALGKAAAVVSAHKLAAVAVGVVVLGTAPGFVVAGGTWYGLGGTGGSVDILGFGTRTGASDEGTFEAARGWIRLPASAVEPGETLRACKPLYFDSYVRVEGMQRGTRWSLATTVDGDAFGPVYAEVWRRRGSYTSGIQSYNGPPGGSSTGKPVPYGRWTVVVRIGDEERARSEVRLVEDC
jgi:tetratricopeptide (TPR) repeat protein